MEVLCKKKHVVIAHHLRSFKSYWIRKKSSQSSVSKFVSLARSLMEQEVDALLNLLKTLLKRFYSNRGEPVFCHTPKYWANCNFEKLGRHPLRTLNAFAKLHGNPFNSLFQCKKNQSYYTTNRHYHPLKSCCYSVAKTKYVKARVWFNENRMLRCHWFIVNFLFKLCSFTHWHTGSFNF